MNGGSQVVNLRCIIQGSPLMYLAGEVDFSTPEAFRLAPAIVGIPTIGFANRKYIAE